MQSSRIILNSRYFHIAQPGEKADGKFSMTKDAAAGLVDYVATREGVSLNFNALDLNFKTSQKPATLPQIRIIEKLIKEFPETKDTFEYKDFRTNPNIGNASEFIARAAELGLGYSGGLITDEATNLVEYVAKRPGVDRVGKHGLFSSSKNVSISKAQDEIANCKGNIWTHVISIRREDADMLGYDHQKPWRDMVISKIDKIAKASNIPISQLHWYAGMHNTGHHPHIHLFVFSDDATCGHLSVEGINQMKAEFSEVIFHDERQHIYEHKDEIRNEIKDQVENLLSDIQENPTGQFKETEIKNISTELKELAATLNSLDGKKSYGYLPRNIKEQVNQIMADLSTAPNIQKLYELYCNDHKELEKMYRNEPDEAISIINNKEFTSVKNQIIKEAVKLQDLVSLKSGSTSAFYKEQKRDIHQSEDNKISSLLSANDESLFENEPPIADNSYEEYDISESYEADQQETRQSFSDDESLFNAEPPHELKQAHTDDYEPPVNEAPPSFHQSHKAVEDFSSTYNNAVAGDTESRYQIAKCYFYGKGVEQDYTQAQMWYGLAAASGHSSAKYELGKMYLYGIGIEKDIKLGTDYCLDAYWDFRGTIAEKTGIDIGHEIDDTNIPLEMLDLPSADKHIGYLEYCLGRMEYAGEGVTRDYEKSAKWFAAASFHDHVHSQYYLGKQYYGGEGVTQNYNDAAGWYKSAAQNKDKYAMYALGKMYYNGKGVEQDYKQAAKWYSKASQNNVSYADYALAKMCEQGFGVDKDIEVSCILYKKALDEFISQEKQQPDAITEYRIAQMYLTGKGTEPNLKNAVEWFTKCAENDDPRAQYQLADLYQRGEGVKPDETKAHELYHKALHGFIKIENETPSAAQEYKIAKMYQKGLGTDVNMSEAINWFTIAAENNHPHAAYQLGKFYIGGVFVKKDCAAAINWFTKSAEAEDKYAMYALGKMYYNGTGVEQDYKEAVEWYSKASQHNVSYADYALAKMLEQGLGVDKNLETSSTLYKKSLVEFISQEQQQPDAVTEYRIAEMYLKGKGVERSAALAAEWLVKSAAMENCDAQYQLAALYQRGEGVQIDKIKSYELYQKALGGFTKAEEDESNAVREYKIAQLFQKGLGTEVNNPESIKWFTAAAEHEHSHAAYCLGKLYTDIKQDYGAAMQWYIKSTELGDPYAMYALGKIYRDGIGMTKNSAAAFSYFLRAANLNHDYAQFEVAKMLLFGNGVPYNPVEAAKWFKICADKGNAYALFQLAEMFKNGFGVEMNQAEAQKLYGQALSAFQNIFNQKPTGTLAYKIGQMYLHGLGSTMNPLQANNWFLKAAQHYTQESRNGNVNSMCALGKMYHHGVGVDQDINKATYWYHMAAENGNEYAQEQLNNINAFQGTVTNAAVLGALGGIIKNLSHSLSRNVIDSTTHKYRQDRKLMQKEMRLKAIQGQKRGLEQYM